MSSIAVIALVAAVVAEAGGTISLRIASSGRKRWWVGVVLGYLIGFTLFGVVLAQGVQLGVAYGIWAASGVALTALLGWLLFKEPLTAMTSVGIALIVGGVLLIEAGAA